MKPNYSELSPEITLINGMPFIIDAKRGINPEKGEDNLRILLIRQPDGHCNNLMELSINLSYLYGSQHEPFLQYIRPDKILLITENPEHSGSEPGLDNGTWDYLASKPSQVLDAISTICALLRTAGLSEIDQEGGIYINSASEI